MSGHLVNCGLLKLFLITNTSRKGMQPSFSCSTVKFIESDNEFSWLRISVMSIELGRMANISST